MPACPDCEYTTPVAKRMAHHLHTYRHGRTARNKKYSEYYLSGKKKAGGDKKAGGKKK